MNLPHHYTASASASPEGNVSLTGDGLSEIQSHAPKEFGGPGGQWSPEDLLVAAVADCFVLSFRAIAAMSKFDWITLRCEASGTLDKIDRAMQFTAFDIKATLTVPESADKNRAQRLLEKAEATCFITNSLKAGSHLETTIETA